jgi:hypothetical protein
MHRLRAGAAVTCSNRGRSQGIGECSLARERLDALVDPMLQHADPRQDNYSAIAC